MDFGNGPEANNILVGENGTSKTITFS